MVFFRVKTGQLQVQQGTGPHECVMSETVSQHLHGLFNLFLYQRLFCDVVKQSAFP